MKAGPEVAVAVGVGYFLGRTRKMRLALMLAATGTIRGGRQAILQQGKKVLTSSPELASIADTVRGELLNAARAAAITAATSRLDAFNERLQERAGGLRPSLEGEKGSEDDEKADTKKSADEKDEDTETDVSGNEEATSEEDSEEEVPEPEQRSAGRAARERAAPRKSRRSADESDGQEGRTAKTRRNTSTGRAPIRRTSR